VIVWLLAHGSFWVGVLLLVVAAVVDTVHSARRAREERQAAVRRHPVVRKRGRASVPSEPRERSGVGTLTP